MLAAMDTSADALNYNQVFERDFFPSALAFLVNGNAAIVKNFLMQTLRLQAAEIHEECFKLGEGVMPGSFKVNHLADKADNTIADFGETTIGRVAPVSSGFWWIILLHAYTRFTGDVSLAEHPDFQKAMRLNLSICLAEGFENFPALISDNGSCVIERSMSIYGYPTEIEALFVVALRSALSLLDHDNVVKDFAYRITKRLCDIYRYKTEEYSHTAVNKFSVVPDSLPDPAIESHGWQIVTGCALRNTRGSYHDGGSWQVLLWLFSAACIKTRCTQMAKDAIEIAHRGLKMDNWPEYYDGKPRAKDKNDNEPRVLQKSESFFKEQMQDFPSKEYIEKQMQVLWGEMAQGWLDEAAGDGVVQFTNKQKVVELADSGNDAEGKVAWSSHQFEGCDVIHGELLQIIRNYVARVESSDDGIEMMRGEAPRRFLTVIMLMMIMLKVKVKMKAVKVKTGFK